MVPFYTSLDNVSHTEKLYLQQTLTVDEMLHRYISPMIIGDQQKQKSDWSGTHNILTISSGSKNSM